MSGKTLGSFSTKEREAGADLFMEECRQIILSSTEGAALGGSDLAQASASLAVQRIMQWSARRQFDGVDADVMSSQVLVGALTGVGIGVAMHGYDVDDVLRRGTQMIRGAAKDARAEFDVILQQKRRGYPKGPWD